MSASQLASPCWVTIDESGDEVHDKTKADNSRWAVETPKLLPSPCFAVTCDECGYAHDEYGDFVQHFATLDAAKAAVLDAGWCIADGKYYCPADECTHTAGRAASCTCTEPKATP